MDLMLKFAGGAVLPGEQSSPRLPRTRKAVTQQDDQYANS
jgi:hypothetical protein